ncbi:hypothetical protein PGT21_030369 [Puccinia graminis f. sp. tritici]|uniref:Uncharacterized protein n=1 Tax=Puccinia graminis f. sp. tritici TaxID=56615 RepID=A0A5B0MQ07_PUCGR|nr:hypothetical protein PGT21_030369 [Puccinia graminis f. sp. tritici]
MLSGLFPSDSSVPSTQNFSPRLNWIRLGIIIEFSASIQKPRPTVCPFFDLFDTPINN